MIKRKKFANWVRTNFRKEDTTTILFSGEKFFDIDGVCNSQNDRVWAVETVGSKIFRPGPAPAWIIFLDSDPGPNPLEKCF